MSERYKAVEGSESAHCCFEATVVDTQTPHPMFTGEHNWVCECFDMENAQKIADALNTAPATEAVRLFISRVERIAMSMKAPNIYTPQLMEACVAMRAALCNHSK